MRKLDDIIVSTINTVLPTDSFHPNGEAACKDLYQQLNDGNKKREKSIKDCISVATERVKNLKEEREKNSNIYNNNNNKEISKTLRSEQTKVSITVSHKQHLSLCFSCGCYKWN